MLSLLLICLSTYSLIHGSALAWPAPPLIQGAGVKLGGRIYHCGGYDSNSPNSVPTDTEILDRCFYWDVKTKTYTEIASYPINVRGACMVTDGTYIYSFGGYNTDYISAWYIYDPSTDTWNTPTSQGFPTDTMLASTFRPVCVHIKGDNIIHIVGGENNENGHMILSLESQSWTSAAGVPGGVAYAAGAASGSIYVIGGASEGSISSKVYRYHPNQNKWKTKADLPTPLTGHVATAHSGSIYVAGGSSTNFQNKSPGDNTDLYIYDTQDDSWTTKADYFPLPTKWAGAIAFVVYDEVHQLHVLGGGYGGSTLTHYIDFCGLETCADNACQTASCSEYSGCVFTDVADDTDCDDLNPCTESDSCQAGKCQGTPKTCTPLDQCHTAGVCDPGSGQCSDPVKEGFVCDDSDPCTLNDACDSGGDCVGTQKSCPGTDCLQDGTCNSSTGECENDPKTGELCNDGNAGTSSDTCQADGNCQGVAPVKCAPLSLVDCTPDKGCVVCAPLGVCQEDVTPCAAVVVHGKSTEFSPDVLTVPVSYPIEVTNDKDTPFRLVIDQPDGSIIETKIPKGYSFDFTADQEGTYTLNGWYEIGPGKRNIPRGKTPGKIADSDFTATIDVTAGNPPPPPVGFKDAVQDSDIHVEVPLAKKGGLIIYYGVIPLAILAIGLISLARRHYKRTAEYSPLL